MSSARLVRASSMIQPSSCKTIQVLVVIDKPYNDSTIIVVAKLCSHLSFLFSLLISHTLLGNKLATTSPLSHPLHPSRPYLGPIDLTWELRLKSLTLSAHRLGSCFSDNNNHDTRHELQFPPRNLTQTHPSVARAINFGPMWGWGLGRKK